MKIQVFLMSRVGFFAGGLLSTAAVSRSNHEPKSGSSETTDSRMNNAEAIAALEGSTRDARRRLPEEVFLFISRLISMVSVDWLIQDEQKGTLLTWRDDEHFGPGWHLPEGSSGSRSRWLTG